MIFTERNGTDVLSLSRYVKALRGNTVYLSTLITTVMKLRPLIS